MPISSDLLTLSEVSSLIPGRRGSRRLAPATITRWINAGCPARGGLRVRLAATRAGGRWLVSQAALDVFFQALAADPGNPRPAARTTSAAAAAARLEAVGA